MASARRGLQQTKPVRSGKLPQAPHTRFTDGSGRGVDHPQKRHIVPRIVDQLQVSDDVFYFLALEKLDTVNNLVGNTAFPECDFKTARQGVHPVENREIAGTPLATLNRPGNLLGNILRFLLIVRIGHQPDWASLFVVGKEVFFFSPHIMGDQFRRDRKNPFCAAVILFQPHNTNVGKILFKLEDVVEIRAPPSINRLIRIPGNGQVGVLHRDRPGNGVLHKIGVLVFVDHDEAKGCIQAVADLRRLPQEEGEVHQQIIKIHRVGPP